MVFPETKIVDRDYAYRIALMSLADRHSEARDIVRAYADGRLVEIKATDRICTVHDSTGHIGYHLCDRFVPGETTERCEMVDVMRMEPTPSTTDTGIEQQPSVPYGIQEPETAT